MLLRLYAHNYRCFENFEFKPGAGSAALLLGRNGSGKSTVRSVLEIFQAIGRGRANVTDLVTERDFCRGRSDVPMSFALEVEIGARRYSYELAFELPTGFRSLRVLRESLMIDGVALFRRNLSEITVSNIGQNRGDAVFLMDWHLIALPVIKDRAASDSLQSMRDWLRRMVLLAPLPALMKGETGVVEPLLGLHAENLVDWLGALLESHPSVYSSVMDQLRSTMPDIELLRFERLGRDSRALLVKFKSENSVLELGFEQLSDGEKCFVVGAVVAAANKWDGPLFVFWDEPDNFLAAHEVGQFVMALKRNFAQEGGQLIACSHHQEAVLYFSVDNVWIMTRPGHLEPSLIRCWADIRTSGDDLVRRLVEGEI